VTRSSGASADERCVPQLDGGSVRVAYLHVLPLEYYPPATSTLTVFSRQPGWTVSAWTSGNRRGLSEWQHRDVEVRRPGFPRPDASLPGRTAGYAAWHVRVAAEIAAFKPDVLISVEPHSALAAWLYYKACRGAARLFIHHHEYYAPEDFAREGMRVLRRTLPLERRDLFPRAEWVSQTNDERLRLLREWSPGIRDGAARVLPNYPTRQWVTRAAAIPRTPAAGVMRLIYIGSASFEDTFIREAAEWVAHNPGTASLHVAGNNIQPDVWRWLAELGAPNVTSDSSGFEYDELPELLRQFDVGLVLYKGNTANFVHNVPNKAIEYLACGLNVWYPIQMIGMSDFGTQFPAMPEKAFDFGSLPLLAGERLVAPAGLGDAFPFTAEAALAPMIGEIAMPGSGERRGA